MIELAFQEVYGMAYEGGILSLLLFFNRKHSAINEKIEYHNAYNQVLIMYMEDTELFRKVSAIAYISDKKIKAERQGLKKVPMDQVVERTGNEFKYQDKIKLQAASLIQHCFQIRNYSENAKRLDDFSKAGLAANKRTISTKIKEVNDLCKKRNQKPVFHKFENEKWGFNPMCEP